MLRHCGMSGCPFCIHAKLSSYAKQLQRNVLDLVVFWKKVAECIQDKNWPHETLKKRMLRHCFNIVARLSRLCCILLLALTLLLSKLKAKASNPNKCSQSAWTRETIDSPVHKVFN